MERTMQILMVQLDDNETCRNISAKTKPFSTNKIHLQASDKTITNLNSGLSAE